MLEKNYTKSEDKCRFGFSESGTFRAAYKSETFFVIFFAIFFISSIVGGIIGGAIFLRTNMDSIPNLSDPTFFAMAGAIIFIGAGVLGFVIAKIGTAYVRRGYECTYDATDEVFTANIGGNVHTIKYCDVSAVKFTPRAIFKKVTGYNIDITVGNRVEHFALAFEGQYQSEKTTPFYIIKERMGIIENRRSDEAAKLEAMKSRATSPLGPADIEKARERRQSALERTKALYETPAAVPLSEPKPADNAMPSVGLNTAPAAERIKLSPTVEGLAAEQTRIAEGERAKNLTFLEQANRSRELDEQEIVGQGSFFLGKMGAPRTICIIAEIILSLFELFELLSFILQFPTSLFSEKLVITSGITLGYLALSTPLFMYIRGSDENRYFANAREFSFSRRDGKGAVAHFFYKDVLSVDYAPHKFLWHDNGYYVTIETKSGFYTYKYVFPRYKHSIPIKDLPFEVIRSRIDPNIKLPEQQSVRLGLPPKQIAAFLAPTVILAAISVLAIVCHVLFARYRTGMNVPLSDAVVITLLSLVGITFFLWKIRCGADHRFRADDRGFIVRRTDGTGKTIRASFGEIEQIRVKKGVFTALFRIKCKTRVIRLRYVYPKAFSRTRLEDTPLGVFLTNR